MNIKGRHVHKDSTIKKYVEG